LIVAKNEVAINTAQACRFIQKKRNNAAVSTNQESIITLKRFFIQHSKKHPGITISDIKSGTIFEMKKSNPE
jgi:hypothetical protein